MAVGSMPGSGLVWDNRALADLLRGPSGPVARMQIRNGQIVRRGAQRRVGVSKPPPLALGRQFHVRRPGTLRDSIVSRLVNEGGELVVYVGSYDPIALLHHQGTVPHEIHPRHRGGTLVFWSRKRGRITFVRDPAFVKHPGTRPNRYLTDSLFDLRF